MGLTHSQMGWLLQARVLYRFGLLYRNGCVPKAFEAAREGNECFFCMSVIKHEASDSLQGII